jgi:hypothetical protein
VVELARTPAPHPALVSPPPHARQALKGLTQRLAEVRGYVSAVLAGRLPLNHDILELLQEAANLLPNMAAESLSGALAGAGCSALGSMPGLEVGGGGRKLRGWWERQNRAH